MDTLVQIEALAEHAPLGARWAITLDCEQFILAGTLEDAIVGFGVFLKRRGVEYGYRGGGRG